MDIGAILLGVGIGKFLMPEKQIDTNETYKTANEVLKKENDELKKKIASLEMKLNTTETKPLLPDTPRISTQGVDTVKISTFAIGKTGK